MQKKNTRPSWDEYFMGLAESVASRSSCSRRMVGAVAVRDRRVISTGYNGTPRGCRNCDEGGCPRCSGDARPGSNLGECFCSHGEENVITQAAYHGISLKGASIYCTFSSCLLCAKMMINAGIKELVYPSGAEYPMAESAVKLMREAGLEVKSV